MSRFELFTMIFYALDASWDDMHNEELGQFLSDANPFLFEDAGSADPAVFTLFCQGLPEQIDVSDSYDMASAYIKSLDNIAIKNAWEKIDPHEWEEGVCRYLSEPHKND